MTSQVVLNNVKSTQANPMGYWTVTLTPSNRTANSVTIKCDATCTLNSSSSSTQMGVTCSIYLGGSWYDFVMVPYGTWWTGNSPKTTSTTVTISGLSASQTSITGIQFKAWAGDGEGPGISATSCANLAIDSHDGSVPDASVPQVVLNNSQSSLSSPYGFWTVTLTPRNRTTNSVVIDCEMSCSLQASGSYTGYRVTCGMYLGGAWHDVEINPSGNSWSGTSPRTARMTVTVSGLTASQTSITGIKFRAAAADGWGPGTADKSCANLNIPSANAASTWSLSSSSINIGSSFSASITPVISTNYHKFKLASGSNSASYGNYTTSASIAATADVVGYWFGGSATSLSGTLTMYTYDSSGTYLGESSKTVTIKMTSAAGAPTGLTVSHSSTSKGSVKFTFVAPNAKYNASISSYTVSSNVGTASRSGTTVTVTVPSGASASTVTLTVTAKDSRGYTTSANKSVDYNGQSTFSLNKTSINLGSSLTVSVDEWVASNTYTLTANGVTFVSKGTGSSTSCTFAADKFGSLFAANSKTARVTLTCTTYNSSGTSLGSTTKTVTLNMTKALGAPTGMSVAKSSVAKGTVKFTITTPTTKYGATISSYTVTPNIGTASRSGTTVTVTVPSGASASSVTVSVTAKDSRGYTTSASGSADYNGKSTFTLNKSSINLGESITVSVDEWVAANTYTLTANGVTFVSKGTGSSTSCSFSAANFGSLFAATEKSASVTLACTTYNSSGTSLGTTNKTVTLNMTEALGAPSGMSIAKSSVEKGTVKFTITTPTTKYNATISSYTVTPNIGTASRSGTTITVTIPSGASSSTVTVDVTAKDSRGYTTSASGSADYNGASTFSFGSTNINLDSSITVSVNEWVASNTYTLTANGVTFASKATGNSTTCKFSAANFGSLFASDSVTANTTMTCTTYNSSGSTLGSATTKTINLTMPSSVGAPTGMKLSIASATNTEIVVTITAPSTKYGATISDYVVLTNNGNAAINGNTITVTNPNGFGNSRVQISAYAVDSRGFTSNTAVVEKLNTIPKILLNDMSYEKVISHNKNVVAIYRGSTRIM